MKAHEIKLRAWDKENGCFWYSEKFTSLSKFFEYMENLEAQGNEIIFERATGQKGVHNKDVYEGDIVDLVPSPDNEMHSHMHGIRAVEFDKEYFQFSYKPFIPLAWGGHKSRDVIGNIHENPELLKDGTP